VCSAIQSCIDKGEKVLVFCHHYATASELLSFLEKNLTINGFSGNNPPDEVWREAWRLLSNDWYKLGILEEDNNSKHKENKNIARIAVIINWLCSPGIRNQISSWLKKPAGSAKKLAAQIEETRPRNVSNSSVPTIFDSAKHLTKVLLDPQSKSTRGLLDSIAKENPSSHFPGRLDDNIPVMGAWSSDNPSEESPNSLYTGELDIVIALFNSPFGSDVLVTTDRLSEGVDLHRWCRHLIHYELDPSPVRTIQRNGRIRRINSWAAVTQQEIMYAYPAFGGTRDEKSVEVMRRRIDVFGVLLGGVPPLDDAIDENLQNSADAVIHKARDGLEARGGRDKLNGLKSLNRNLGI
jgi:ERCC4-related helicase